MADLLQLNPPLSVVTPGGRADCHALIFSSPENELLFLCADRATGGVVLVPHQDIRFGRNYTMRRNAPEIPNPAPGFMSPTPYPFSGAPRRA